MDLISKLQSGVDGLARTSYFQGRLRLQARQTFISNRSENLFWGVHDNWDLANAEANDFGAAGYNNDASAAIYDYRTRIDAHDYPALYWLVRSMHDGLRSVADVGGSIGIKFLAFQDALKPWQDMRWTVHDVPAAVSRGRALAFERGNDARLHFADRFEDLQGSDVLYASGVLQYLPQMLGELLEGWQSLPKRIVINTVPIHPERAFFTVNSIGTAYCPYRVQTQAILIRGLTRMGYRLRETWINPDKLMTIPLHPELSLRHYSGFCLDRTG